MATYLYSALLVILSGFGFGYVFAFIAVLAKMDLSIFKRDSLGKAMMWMAIPLAILGALVGGTGVGSGLLWGSGLMLVWGLLIAQRDEVTEYMLSLRLIGTILLVAGAGVVVVMTILPLVPIIWAGIVSLFATIFAKLSVELAYGLLGVPVIYIAKRLIGNNRRVSVAKTSVVEAV